MKPNTIEFRSTSDNTWVMRITANKKIEVNEDVDVTFAAKKVLDAMQGLLIPQRTWVGLTPDEIRGISLASGESLFSAIMFTHDKLKEKNT